MKENIKKLLGLKIPSNYKISQVTGIAQTTLSDYATGKSNLGNMKLDHAIKLNNYYEVVLMMEKLKINEKDITKAKDEFNNWSGSAVIWIDFEDGHTWCTVGDEVAGYDKEGVYHIVAKDEMIDPNAKYSVDRLVRLANLKHTYYNNNESDLLINSLDANDIR